MTDLSRSYFALNKLIFSRCKALYKKKKKGNWVHSQILIQGFPNRRLLARYWRRVLCSGINLKKMRNQIKQTNQNNFTLCSFLLFCKSLPEVRKPWCNNHFSLYRTYIYVLRVQRRKGSLCYYSPCKSLQVLRLQKAFQDCCPVLYMNPSKHLYQRSSFWEKIKQADTYPGQLCTYWTWYLIT